MGSAYYLPERHRGIHMVQCPAKRNNPETKDIGYNMLPEEVHDLQEFFSFLRTRQIQSLPGITDQKCPWIFALYIPNYSVIWFQLRWGNCSSQNIEQFFSHRPLPRAVKCCNDKSEDNAELLD